MQNEELIATIAKLRGLLAKATPGPWRVIVDDSGDRPLCVPSIQASEELDCAIVHWDGFWQKYWQSARGESEWNANADLIVAAINALPHLLDHLEALTSPPGDVREKVALIISPYSFSGHPGSLAWNERERSRNTALAKADAILSYLADPRPPTPLRTSGEIEAERLREKRAAALADPKP
jgi:hypothetical protein